MLPECFIVLLILVDDYWKVRKRYENFDIGRCFLRRRYGDTFLRVKISKRGQRLDFQRVRAIEKYLEKL